MPRRRRNSTVMHALLAIAVLWPALSTTVLGADERGLAVVPPGFESVLAEMIGRGAELPSSCKLTDAGIDRTHVRSRYDCPGGEVEIELRHPDAAPDGTRKTDKFALVVVEGTVPAPLEDALIDRIRAREEGFQWSWTPLPGDEEGNDYFALIGRALATVSLVLLIAVILGWWLQRRVRGGRPVRPTWTSTLLVTVATVAACGLVHAGLRLTGSSLGAIVAGEPAGSVAVRVIGVLGLILAAAVAVAIAARFGADSRMRLWAIVLVLLYLVVGYGRSLEPDDLHYFGSLSTYPPSSTLGETLPGADAPVRYRVNSLGFRYPDFDLAKPDGTIRIVLIGDSFVFGIGVNYDGTLRPHLERALTERWPGRSFEIVNLGIPGNNLASHVAMFEEATERLAPDVVILGLTLANDLSAWDEQDARRDLRRYGAYSFARFLIGDAVESLWALLYLERETTPSGLTRLDRHMTRLMQRLAELDPRPILVLFGFQPWDPPIAERLEALKGVAVVPNRTTTIEDFIPGDGHPTSFGNRRSADQIVDTLSVYTPWRSLVAD